MTWNFLMQMSSSTLLAKINTNPNSVSINMLPLDLLNERFRLFMAIKWNSPKDNSSETAKVSKFRWNVEEFSWTHLCSLNTIGKLLFGFHYNESMITVFTGNQSMVCKYIYLNLQRYNNRFWSSVGRWLRIFCVATYFGHLTRP